MKCWKELCENDLEFTCPCTNPPIYSCDLHISAHLCITSKSEHNPEPLKISSYPETTKALIDFLHKSLSDLYEIRKKTVHDFSIQIKQLNDKMKITLSSFDKAIKEQRKMISQINLIESGIKANETELDEILILEPEESIKRLKECFNIFDKSNFLIDDAGKLIKRETSLNELNRFCFFLEGSKKIIEIDLSNFSTTQYNLQLEIPRSEYISMCLIPGNSIFCFGNYSTPTNIAFIIKPNNSVKQVINAPFSLSLSGSIYYNSNIYIFGGGGFSPENYAFKYSLSENNWEKLNPMPANSSFVSCFAQNNRILLSGRDHSKIYCYDITQNNYTELHSMQYHMSKIWRKIVCGNDKNAYVIETDGYIYESNHEWKIWNTIGNSGIENSDWIGYTLLWKKKVYFAFWSYDVYEFDLKEKKIQKFKINW